MEIKEILSHIDHTLLSSTATWSDITRILDQGIKYKAASACIPPCFVAEAKKYVGGALPICTVIGFPLGYSTTATKVVECRDAIQNGADELDVVVNLSWVKDGNAELLVQEFTALRDATQGHILKLILETGALNPFEITTLCQMATKAEVDYVKTSTGFGTRGATPDDILLMSSHIGPKVKIKASGGIRTLEDAQQYLLLGADRIGSSRILEDMEKLSQADS